MPHDVSRQVRVRGTEILSTDRQRYREKIARVTLDSMVQFVGLLDVVDDNEDGAEMLAEALIGKGYDTRVAHDAPAALRVAAEFLPDVAFLDLGLPVMDGYELAAQPASS